MRLLSSGVGTWIWGWRGLAPPRGGVGAGEGWEQEAIGGHQRKFFPIKAFGKGWGGGGKLAKKKMVTWWQGL